MVLRPELARERHVKRRCLDDATARGRDIYELAIRLKATRGLNIKVADLEVVIRDECIPSQISLEKALRGISGVLVRCRLRCPLIFGRDARQNTDSFRQLDPVM